MKIVGIEPLGVEIALLNELVTGLNPAPEFIFYENRTTDTEELIRRLESFSLLIFLRDLFPNTSQRILHPGIRATMLQSSVMYISPSVSHIVKNSSFSMGDMVEKYYIVIYGDVNGDSGISATDVSALLREVNGLTGWSIADNEEYNYAKVLAANLKTDDGVNGIDASLLRDVTLSVAYIDQTTGAVIHY